MELRPPFAASRLLLRVCCFMFADSVCSWLAVENGFADSPRGLIQEDQPLLAYHPARGIQLSCPLKSNLQQAPSLRQRTEGLRTRPMHDGPGMSEVNQLHPQLLVKNSSIQSRTSYFILLCQAETVAKDRLTVFLENALVLLSN